MWTATLQSVKPDPANPENSLSTIVFSNGKQTITDIESGLDAQGLVNYCRDKINALTHIDSMAEYIANPPLGVIDISVPAPTADEIAKQQVDEALSKARKAKEIADLKASDDPDVQAAMDKVTAAQASIELTPN